MDPMPRSVLRPIRLLATAVLAAGALAACSGPEGEATPSPVVLTIGTNDNPETWVTGEIVHFAELVAEASQGRLIIEPQWGFGGESTPHWDQVVGQAVIDGGLDLGLIPTRAWDALGVTSL